MPPFAPTFNDADDDEQRDIVNRLKRRISELEVQQRKDQSQSNVAFQVVAAFDSVESLIAEDDRRRELEDARTRGDEIHEEEQEPTTEQNLLHNGYKELCRFIIPIRKLLAEAEHEELAPVLTALRAGSRNARSDDTKNVREAIVPWLTIVYPELNPPLDGHSRENRGIYHDDLSRLLCPVEFDWADKDVRTAIRESDPDYQITADSWWAGLYPIDKFYPTHPDARLFTNILLLKVYKFIFTSPFKSKRNVAAIIGLKAVTGRSIAYAAYRVALSDASHWDDQDGAFDYREFYNNVVEYFEFPPGPVARQEVTRLLDWWNVNVFGTTPRWSLYEGSSSHASTSSVSIMRAARAARETDV
ncbi:hypothetical protein B0H13DRAFT_2648853 [Mycena leptocephala]|nr:hypothetical protein B0H13DRAFT_2648853 [Mycena leptocephala]